MAKAIKPVCRPVFAGRRILNVEFARPRTVESTCGVGWDAPVDSELDRSSYLGQSFELSNYINNCPELESVVIRWGGGMKCSVILPLLR